MLKKYRNILVSLGFLLASIIWIALWILLGKNLLIESPTNTIEAIYIIPHFIFVIAGIFFSLKSNKEKESLWLGSLLSVIGIVWLIIASLALYLSSMQ